MNRDDRIAEEGRWIKDPALRRHFRFWQGTAAIQRQKRYVALLKFRRFWSVRTVVFVGLVPVFGGASAGFLFVQWLLEVGQ